MEGFDDMGMSPYLSNSMPMGNIDAETYPGILPALGITEHITPSFDTSDFTM